VLPLAAALGPDRAGAFLERYDAALRERGEDGTELLLEPLQELATLPAWADAAARATLADDPAGRDVRAFRWALAWYRPAAAALPEQPFPFEAGEVAGRDWRARVALGVRFLDASAGVLGKRGAQRLWVSTTPEGSRTWQLDTLRDDPAPPPDADASRVVVRRFYDERGILLGERSLRIVRQGKRFLEIDVRATTLLDLGDPHEPLSVNAWGTLETVEVPTRLPVPQAAVAEFQRARKARDWTCLVLSRARESTWFSPEVGLLMHDDPGKIHRELVYADLSGD
jgi:hypothetical protein